MARFGVAAVAAVCAVVVCAALVPAAVAVSPPKVPTAFAMVVNVTLVVRGGGTRHLHLRMAANYPNGTLLTQYGPLVDVMWTRANDCTEAEYEIDESCTYSCKAGKSCAGRRLDVDEFAPPPPPASGCGCAATNPFEVLAGAVAGSNCTAVNGRAGTFWNPTKQSKAFNISFCFAEEEPLFFELTSLHPLASVREAARLFVADAPPASSTSNDDDDDDVPYQSARYDVVNWSATAPLPSVFAIPSDCKC